MVGVGLYYQFQRGVRRLGVRGRMRFDDGKLLTVHHLYCYFRFHEGHAGVGCGSDEMALRSLSCYYRLFNQNNHLILRVRQATMHVTHRRFREKARRGIR